MPRRAARGDAIVAEGLQKSFGKVRALDGIDLTVKEGTVVGLLGPNGAGKTTAVRILTTLLSPDAGRATVLGYDVTKEPDKVRASIGLTGQFTAVDDNLTGVEFLRMVGRLYHMSSSHSRSRADELLERFDLSDAAGRTVKTYSGGMQRRLDLAASLVNSPRVLFLDEPTTGLDPQSRNAMWDEISRLAADDGVTVFLTTQYLEEADVLAARVGIIDHGRIVAEGTPEALKAEIGRPSVEAIPAKPQDRQRVAEVLLRFGDSVPGTPRGVTVRLRDATLADVVRALDAEGLLLEHLELHQPSLDDVFLAKTGQTLEGAQRRAEGREPAEDKAAAIA
jgi:ABC-2 type transport system ATP-binding protein